MHDIRAIRDDPAAFDAALARRGLDPLAHDLLALDAARRDAIGAGEAALAERNSASKRVGAAKAAGDEAEFERLRALVAARKEEIARLEDETRRADAALAAALLEIPNLPDADVPDGASEEDNVELRRWGTPAELDFAPREHFEIPGVVPGMDFETAAKMSGARFVMLRGAVARLHRALAQWMLDVHTTENGLVEHATPVLVRDDAMTGTDKLPKFGDDSFRTREGYWLIPTSEVTLTYSVAGEVLAEADLPRRMTAHTLCFRSEAGSAGRDTAGMLRQHQFEKVEMVSVVHPDRSREELDRMTGLAEDLLRRLGLPFRTVVLCTGDMGFGARRTHDIEVWMPGQGMYREISSCSTTGDFQARRMNARFRPEGGGKPEFVHTLNGSGLAVGRCLIAVLENGQRADGSVALPEALAPWLGGAREITAAGALA
jgi:seryl-tRNA synthetase